MESYVAETTKRCDTAATGDKGERDNSISKPIQTQNPLTKSLQKAMLTYIEKHLPTTVVPECVQ